MNQEQQREYMRTFAGGLEVFADELRQAYDGLYGPIETMGGAGLALANSVGMGGLSAAYESVDQDANEFEDLVASSVERDELDPEQGTASITYGKALAKRVQDIGGAGVRAAFSLPENIRNLPEFATFAQTIDATFRLHRLVDQFVVFLEDFWRDDSGGGPGEVPIVPPPNMDWDDFGKDWDKWTDFDPTNPHTGAVGYQLGDEPGKGEFVPVQLNGSQALSPIKALLDIVRGVYAGEGAITLHLPSGLFEGRALGGTGWNDAPRYSDWWDGKKTGGGSPVVGLAFPKDNSGWILEAGPTSQGYGQSISFQCGNSSKAYVTWNMCVYGSRDNTVAVGHYKNFSPNRATTLHQFHGIMLGHRGGTSARTTRPISTNSAAHMLFGVWQHEPNAKEHNKYDRNCAGNTGFVDCLLTGSGGQTFQVVNRKKEGILMPGVLDSHTVWIRTFAAGYNRWDERAANGISWQGSCMHGVIIGGGHMDTPAMHEGAQHRLVQGMISLASGGGPDRTHARPSGAPQGIVEVRNHFGVNDEHDRSPWQFMCEEVILEDCACWGRLRGPGDVSRTIEIKAAVEKLTIKNCNQLPPESDPMVLKGAEILNIQGLNYGRLRCPQVRRDGQVLGYLKDLSLEKALR